MKRSILILLLTLALLGAGTALAAPVLEDVAATLDALTAGEDGWAVTFTASEGGVLAMQLLDAQTGEPVADIGSARVQPGGGRMDWNGLLPDGTPAAAGSYTVALRLLSDAGEESAQALLPLRIDSGAADKLDLTAGGFEDAQVWEDAPSWEDAQVWEDAPSWEDASSWEDAPSREDAETSAVPQATSFWDMNPDAYDLTNPEHQQAIWDLMMQPITVLDVGQTEHVYPTNQPGIKRTPYAENCAGERHGQSQGVHVLEEDTDGDGYVLIESYSNDGTKTDNAFMESIDAQLIRGYVKKSLLFTVQPSDKYALLVDKLRQKMYVFEDGRIIGELLVSTGLNNAKQPYNETPAGEFITVSQVGDFKAGSRTIGRYAIRINGGTLLHEVLHDVAADGKTKLYDAYEPQLGQKASHGCIRIQRRKNEQGMNMQWLWENLPLKTKVFIWDDKGRQMYAPELPDPATPLYRNPNGGSSYHLNANCPGVKEQYLPLEGGFTYGDLESDAYKKLTPCVYCAAPARLATLYERYRAAAEQIGAEITDEAKAAFGIQ